MQWIASFVPRGGHRTGLVTLLFLFVCAGALLAAPAAWAGPGDGDPCACGKPDCPDYPCCACKEKKDPPCPPKYANRRFMEDWRPCLCIPCKDRVKDWSDGIKALRLTRRGNIWANFGGQVRTRFESWHDFGFGGPPVNDDSWMLLRFRVHADVHVGDHFRAYFEGIYADQVDDRNLPGGVRPIDRNRGDLLNAFVEAKTKVGCDMEVGARVGRQELNLGKQRLVSPLDWANTRRTFEGASAWWKKGFHRVDAFAVRPVTIRPDQWDEWDDDRWFFGLNYGNTTMNCISWEAYAFYLQDDRVATDQDRFTVGARADGKIPNTRLDYDVEAAYQFGDIGPSGTISAAMASATLGWKPCVCWDPRFAVGFDYASGDSSPAAAPGLNDGTFHQLFPLAHKYLGHADLIARQNVIAGRLEASATPISKITVLAWLHAFWKAASADVIYNAPGGVLRAPGGSTSTYIGSEIDFMIKYAIDRHWLAAVEYTHFFPGEAITTTGAGQDVDFWWIGVQGTF